MHSAGEGKGPITRPNIRSLSDYSTGSAGFGTSYDICKATEH